MSGMAAPPRGTMSIRQSGAPLPPQSHLGTTGFSGGREGAPNDSWIEARREQAQPSRGGFGIRGRGATRGGGGGGAAGGAGGWGRRSASPSRRQSANGDGNGWGNPKPAADDGWGAVPSKADDGGANDGWGAVPRGEDKGPSAADWGGKADGW